ncbi:MAG TPA: hypothetical protein VLA48_03150 [Nitrososphaeraceae archaeon]|nr:hypothetical protein [Nitrososphaeraceae archaeon]
MLIAEHKLHREEVLEELNKSVPGDVRLLEEYAMRNLFIQQLEELL